MESTNFDVSRFVVAVFVVFLLACTPLTVRDSLSPRGHAVAECAQALLFLAAIVFQLRSRDEAKKAISFPFSVFWIPTALLIGWGPLAAGDLIQVVIPHINGTGFAMAWGLTVALASLFVAGGLVIVDVIWFASSWFGQPGR